MGYDYAWQKFFGATHTMATSDGSLKERLIDAFAYNLIHLHERDFPPDLWKKFKPILGRVTRIEPVNDEGSIVATISRMDTSELHEVAEQVFSMHDEITSIARDW